MFPINADHQPVFHSVLVVLSLKTKSLQPKCSELVLRACVHRVELLPLSPEECGAECLSYRPFAVCIPRRRIRPHALSAL